MEKLQIHYLKNELQIQNIYSSLLLFQTEQNFRTEAGPSQKWSADFQKAFFFSLIFFSTSLFLKLLFIIQILAILFPISTSFSFSFMVPHLPLVTYFKGNLILTSSKSFFSYIILVFSPSRFVPYLTFFILAIIFFIPKIITWNFLTYLYFVLSTFFLSFRVF